MRTLSAFLTTVVLLTSTGFSAEKPIQRKDLDLRLFTQPFKPQTVTPRLFGLLPENDYLQEQVKLTAEQKLRMRQIERQLTRYSTVLDQHDTRTELGLTDEQRDRIREISLDGGKRLEKLFRDWKDSTREKKPTKENILQTIKQGEAIEAEVDRRMLAVLTPPQREKFKTLIGGRIDPAKIFTMKNFRVQGLETARLSRPFKPQITAPRVFGLASYVTTVQAEIELSSEQINRMRQIEIQLTRVSYVLTERDVSTSLLLTPKQIQAVQEMRSREFDSTKPSEQIVLDLWKRTKDPNITTKELRKLTEEMRQELEKISMAPNQVDDAVLGILSRRQNEKFRKTKGETIDLKRVFRSISERQPESTK